MIGLPSYIPEELKTKLLESHPTPIIGASVFTDDRYDNVPADLTLEKIFPPQLKNDKDKLDWVRGMRQLEELGAETLALDSAETGLQASFVQSIPGFLRNRMKDSLKKPGVQIKSIFDIAREKFPDEQQNRQFCQETALALLTHKTDKLDLMVSKS